MTNIFIEEKETLFYWWNIDQKKKVYNSTTLFLVANSVTKVEENPTGNDIKT